MRRPQRQAPPPFPAALASAYVLKRASPGAGPGGGAGRRGSARCTEPHRGTVPVRVATAALPSGCRVRPWSCAPPIRSRAVRGQGWQPIRAVCCRTGARGWWRPPRARRLPAVASLVFPGGRRFDRPRPEGGPFVLSGLLPAGCGSVRRSCTGEEGGRERWRAFRLRCYRRLPRCDVCPPGCAIGCGFGRCLWVLVPVDCGARGGGRRVWRQRWCGTPRRVAFGADRACSFGVARRRGGDKQLLQLVRRRCGSCGGRWRSTVVIDCERDVRTLYVPPDTVSRLGASSGRRGEQSQGVWCSICRAIIARRVSFPRGLPVPVVRGLALVWA